MILQSKGEFFMNANTAQIKGTMAVLAVIGSVIARALGGWDGALKVLVGMMVCDYICGLLTDDEQRDLITSMPAATSTTTAQ
jgi:phage-related holin